MLNITNYRNTSQNYCEVSPNTSQNGHHQKIYKQEMLERMWRKRDSPTLGSNVYWYSYDGEHYGDSLIFLISLF